MGRIGAYLVLGSILLASCATVRPWEREVLARRDMAIGGAQGVADAERDSTRTREGASPVGTGGH